MELDDVRRFALSLPETAESPHFEMASLRVRGKIFVTLPPAGVHVHIFVDEHETRAAVAADRDVFSELWWGKRLSGLRVVLAAADASIVTELITLAWRRKAPKRVVAQYDAAHPTGPG